jgi:hypothetical protein
MTICTWTIVTNTRTLIITGNGSPLVTGGNSRCIGLFGASIQVIKLSGEPDGYCSYVDEYVISSTSANCQGIDPSVRCDCVNGGCVPKTTYNTPGVFPTLAACQSGCAKNSNCTGECVDPAEIAALKQAVNTLQSKICK